MQYDYMVIITFAAFKMEQVPENDPDLSVKQI